MLFLIHKKGNCKCTFRLERNITRNIYRSGKKDEKEYSCNAEDIMCFICPSIRKCHFEVDQEVKDLFYNKFKKLYNIEEIIEENKEKINGT